MKVKLAKLELVKEDYLLFGSVPMLIYELIEGVNDIDILARGQAWEQALKIGTLNNAPKGDEVIAISNDIDIYNGWMGESVDALFERATMVEGFKVASLEDVLAYKLELNRDKDQPHIALLREVLKKPPPLS